MTGEPNRIEHRVIETHRREEPGRRPNGYKRVYLKCLVPHCFRGHVDGTPAASVTTLVELIRVLHPLIALQPNSPSTADVAAWVAQEMAARP